MIRPGPRRWGAGLTLAAALAAWPGAAAQPATSCLSPESGALLDRAAALLQAFDDAGARAVLSSRGADACPDVALAELAVAGWVEARALAPKGGDKSLLEPVNTVLRALAALRRVVADRPSSGPAAASRPLGLQIDYADAAIRAAVDAAQDERGEMAVYLDHARDLALTLDAADDPPIWPVPYLELEGELWLEVDRYAEARAAFSRAVGRAQTARALVGLARAADRQGDRDAACSAYTRALKMEVAAAVKTIAGEYVSKCR